MRSIRRYMMAAGLCVVLVSPAMGQSFSVDPISPSGLPPDDIFGPGPGLIAPGIGAVSVDGHSFGYTIDDWFSGLLGAYFSVDRLGIGLPGTAVNIEAGAPTPGPDVDQSADIYFSPLPPPGGPFTLAGVNTLYSDGDGSTVTPGPPLGLLETGLGPVNDDLDALDMRFPTLGLTPIWYSLDAISAGGGGLASGADIALSVVAPGYDTPPPTIWATSLMLGLSPTDDIDALVIIDGDGDSDFDVGVDAVIFSLAPGSAYLGTPDPFGSGLAIYEGDLLLVGLGATSPGILVPGEDLGLTSFRTYGSGDDNLNALDFAFRSSIPEPGTAAFFLVGLGLVGLFRRRG